MHRLRVPALIAILAAAIWVLKSAGQTPTTATLVIRVPADAKVYISDYLTRETGTTRNFVTPPLTAGKNYSYDIKAEVVRQGQAVTQTQHVTFQAGQTVNVDFSQLGTAVPPPDGGGSAGDAGWPRKITVEGSTITVYQPQLEKWDQNRLEARAAVAVETKASPQPTYGILWITARTDVDKEDRLVTLNDIQIAKATFPAAPDKGENYLAALRKAIPDKAQTVIALDRLEANLTVTQAEEKSSAVPLKNEPPRIIFSTVPAVLVLVDGKPALRQLDGTNLLRVINTRTLLLLDQANGKYYLHLMDRWLETGNLEGGWTVVKTPPAGLATAEQQVKDGNLPADLLDDPAPDVKQVLEGGKVPVVYVSTDPAELIETQGEPQLAPIDGTNLMWVKNTTDEVILDPASQDYYVLLAGRWFRSKSLAKGPWEFVAGDQLPADFAKIPDNHPRGDVLASVAGTPQAKESLIANRIPQTATISRKEANLSVTYDGDPQFEPVEGTTMQYAANSPTPVIQLDPSSYYACENGVWFTAAAAVGPWAVVTAVPPIIYTIPPSCPIYYVTSAYIYGSTPDYVYVGYTPGYFGTCLAPWGGVVWGTGWAYRPWVGRWWFGRPWTYGFGCRFGWTAGGWGFAFGGAVARPWWGPIGWHSAWGGTAWRAGWADGWGGRYNNVHINNINFNNFNAYNRWGNNVRVNTVRNDHLVNRQVTNVGTVNAQRNLSNIPGISNIQRGLNNVYAGNDGNLYRRVENNWEQHLGGNWQSLRPEGITPERRPEIQNLQRSLDNQLAARRSAELNQDLFRSTGGFGGFNGGFNGYHAPSGFRGGGIRIGGRR